MPFDHLPIELVLSIYEFIPIKYLPQCAAVNKQWKALIVPLIWRSVYITLRPLSDDSLVKGIRQGSVDVANFKYTTVLTITCELTMVSPKSGSATLLFCKDIRDWIRDFKLVLARITRPRTPRLKYLKIILCEPNIAAIREFRRRDGLIQRIFKVYDEGLVKFVTTLSRNRDGMQLEVRYSDTKDTWLRPELLRHVLSLSETLTIARVLSAELGQKWGYNDLSLPRLRSLMLEGSRSFVPLELTWTNFRDTGIQYLSLSHFALPGALMVPETLTTLTIIDTPTPVNALLISLFSLPNLENLEVDQSQRKPSFPNALSDPDIWRHADLLSKPIVSTNLRTLKLSKCEFQPEIIYRLALECPNLETLRLLLLSPGSFLVRYITSAAVVSCIELDPYYRRCDYWDAFFRGFGSDFGHVICPVVNLWSYSSSHRAQSLWELRKVSRRPSFGKTFVRVVSDKLQLRTIRRGGDNYAQEQQEWLEREEAKGRIMYWEFKHE